MIIAEILIGICILLLGRKLFWLFVCLLGFWAGLSVAGFFSTGLLDWQILAVGLVCGLFGVILAVFMQGSAVISAGFAAGIFVYLNTFSLYTAWRPEHPLFFIILSGIAGSVLLLIFFNPMLAVATSLIGSLLIVRNLPLELSFRPVVFGALFVIGMLIQFKLLGQGSTQKKSGNNKNKDQD